MRQTRKRIWIGLSLLAGAAAGCAAALDRPTPQDVEWASSAWPGTTMQDLEHGRAVYVDKCAGCHNLFLPEAYPPDEWEGYVAYMKADARLTSEEQFMITRFLVAASARARGVKSAASAAGPPNGE